MTETETIWLTGFSKLNMRRNGRKTIKNKYKREFLNVFESKTVIK